MEDVLIGQGSGCVGQSSPDVVGFQPGILLQSFLVGDTLSQHPDDEFDRNTSPADDRFARHNLRINVDT